MTTDGVNGQAGDNISSKEELSEVLDKELGTSAGYLETKYRDWCIGRPDEVKRLRQAYHSLIYILILSILYKI